MTISRLSNSESRQAFEGEGVATTNRIILASNPLDSEGGIVAPVKRIVAFDLGGVLVRIAKSWSEAMETAGLEHQSINGDQFFHGCPEFEPYQAGKISESEYLAGLQRYLGLSSKEEALKAHNGILMVAYPGTVELVSELRAKGVPTACLSNTNAPHWVAMSNQDLFPGISQLDHPILSHEVRAEKPHEEIYRIFESKTGFSPEQIIFFDDLQPNVDAAIACGWTAFRIDPTTSTEPQLRAHLVELGIL